MTKRESDIGVHLARLRLERHLATSRPDRLAEYVDRLLARTIQWKDPYAEADLRGLLLDRRAPANELIAGLTSGVVCSHLVDGLRLTYLFRRHGIPRHELEESILPFALQLREAADAWREPDRVSFHYWARRLGWSDAPLRFDFGERWDSYEHDVLLMQCDFGEGRAPRHRLLQAGLRRRVLDADVVAPAIVAKALILETACDPLDEETVAALAVRLIALQDSSGGFGGHAAACLAVMALSRVQPDLQLQNCKSS